MLLKVRWAFAVGAGCSLIMGLGIASCSDEAPTENARQAPAKLESDPPESVRPPAAFRSIQTPACVAGGDCVGEFAPAFGLEEIGQSETHLYVALKYVGPSPVNTAVPASGVVEFTVHVSGCKVGGAKARGTVRQTTDGVSWIEIPVGALPDGELELRLRGVVGQNVVFRSIPLLKAGTTVAYLQEHQMRAYREVAETDPRTGATRKVSFLDEPEVECTQ